VSWLSVSASLLLAAGSGAGYVLLAHYDGNISRLPAGIIESSPQATPAPRGSENVLMVGSDSRGDLAAGQGVQGTGATYVKGQRSDTIILAHLFGGGSDQAELVSFPRDSYVVVPSHVDPTTGKTVAAHHDKINAAFEEGGPKLLIQTVEQITSLHVDHFVQIDFDGFKTMVDQLGGVEVCLSQPAKDHFSGIDLPAGRQTIEGDQALAFVRQRHGLANGDLDRIRRQQQFLAAIVRRVLSSHTLLNPVRLNGFLNAATESVTVDRGLSRAGLTDLASRLRGFDAGGVAFVTVPVTTISATRQTSYGPADVVLLDEPRGQELYAALKADRTPGSPVASPSPTPTAPLTVRPGQVRLRVLNGTTTAGLGGRASTDLSGAGFVVVGGVANRFGNATTTVVRYGPGQAEAARTVVAAVPGAVAVADPSLSDTLEVVVGPGYNGVRGGARGTSPTPTASPSPSVATAADDPCAA
jgi:LCP family protein required for cell wall assembly